MGETEMNWDEYWNAVEGWVKIDEVRKHFDLVGCGTIYKTAGEDRVPLYPHPPQRTEQVWPLDVERKWVGLTDDEVYKIAFSLEGENWRKIADAIEAKLKEKNS